MGHDRQRLRRLDGRQRFVVTAASVLAVTVALGLVGARVVQTATQAWARAPGWQGGGVPCRQDPMLHVHHPSRFVVLANCSTVDGTVKQVHRDPVDGDVNLLVEVGRPYRRFLRPANHGLLHVAVIPPDVPRIRIPKAGQRATFHGAWVLDRNKRNLAAMHPAWMIQDPTGGPGPSSAEGSSNRPASQRLLVHIKAPRSVPVGGPMDVFVQVEAVERGARRPVPEASLFFEVTAEDAGGVQWKAAFTNTLGRAHVTLVALENPGSFTLWLYVDKSGRSAVASTPFRVRHR
jgi:hypothetical protein